MTKQTFKRVSISLINYNLIKQANRSFNESIYLLINKNLELKGLEKVKNDIKTHSQEILTLQETMEKLIKLNKLRIY